MYGYHVTLHIHVRLSYFAVMTMHKLLVQSEFRIRTISFIIKCCYIFILSANVYECVVSKSCFLFLAQSVADIADGSVAGD